MNKKVWSSVIEKVGLSNREKRIQRRSCTDFLGEAKEIFAGLLIQIKAARPPCFCSVVTPTQRPLCRSSDQLGETHLPS